MCGIYGVASFEKKIDLVSVQQQIARLTHRGADDGGVWISPDQNIALAHRRLSIIDLSDAGHQPMESNDGHNVIVYNGEIYNFFDLRIELEALGYEFKSTGDTEVVLAAYQAWGEKCVERFNGMFSFAIFDSGSPNVLPSLFLARDRAGKKPLYYRNDGKRFQFSSELKSIDGNGTLNLTALNYYLALGYIPDGLSIATEVNKLPPAHAARLTLPNLHLKIWRYWELPANRSAPCTNGEEIADRTQTLLEDAVKIRLISDVPIGVFLSGGLDSSLVAAAAARQSAGAIKTFTIGMPGSRLDETGYARRVANFLGADHHILETNSTTLKIIHELAPFVDEPLADSSIIPTFILSQLCRRHVKVSLGGDGGDELFGGYPIYANSVLDERRIGNIPRPLLWAAGRMVALLPAGVHGRNRIASLRGGPLEQMIWGTPYFDSRLRTRIIAPDAVAQLGSNLDAPEQWLLGLFDSGRDPVDCMTRAHFGSVLPDDFLVKVDRASMAHGLEIRTPFLDYRLIEFAFGLIPSNWKVHGPEMRRIQRILAKRMLPPDFDPIRKQGFSIPLDEWLRADRCAIVRDHLPYLPDCVNTLEVERLIGGQMKGRANGSRLFALLMLAIAAKNNGWAN